MTIEGSSIGNLASAFRVGKDRPTREVFCEDLHVLEGKISGDRFTLHDLGARGGYFWLRTPVTYGGRLNVRGIKGEVGSVEIDVRRDETTTTVVMKPNSTIVVTLTSVAGQVNSLRLAHKSQAEQQEKRT